jgi:hypothetical protein
LQKSGGAGGTKSVLPERAESSDNGKAEGINNKIKVLKRQAYGFRDQEYFKLRLYNLHKQESQLIG